MQRQTHVPHSPLFSSPSCQQQLRVHRGPRPGCGTVCCLAPQSPSPLHHRQSIQQRENLLLFLDRTSHVLSKLAGKNGLFKGRQHFLHFMVCIQQLFLLVRVPINLVNFAPKQPNILHMRLKLKTNLHLIVCLSVQIRFRFSSYIIPVMVLTTIKVNLIFIWHQVAVTTV